MCKFLSLQGKEYVDFGKAVLSAIVFLACFVSAFLGGGVQTNSLLYKGKDDGGQMTQGSKPERKSGNQETRIPGKDKANLIF